MRWRRIWAGADAVMDFDRAFGAGVDALHIGRYVIAGVARVSFGSGPMRAALGLLQRIAREARESGEFRSMLEHAIPYSANALFPERLTH